VLFDSVPDGLEVAPHDEGTDESLAALAVDSLV